MLNSENFDEIVIKGNKPALIVFTADWCRPCLLQKTVLQSLKEEFDKAVTIESIDVDSQADLAGRFETRNLPTSILFAQGKIIETLPGFQAQEYLKAYIEHIIELQKDAESNQKNNQSGS